MTSNMGSNLIQENFDDLKEDDDLEQVVATTREAVMSLLRQTLRPEFLNRVDEVIMFHPLMRNEIKGIIRIQLADLQEKLQKQGIELEFSDYAINYFAEQGFDPQFGARPLKRLIQKEIVNLLSKKIISGELDKSRPVLIDVFDGVVVVRNEAEKANTAAE